MGQGRAAIYARRKADGSEASRNEWGGDKGYRELIGDRGSHREKSC